MADNLDLILDQCIDRINRGEGLESVLDDYPEYAQQLQPLLQTVARTRQAYPITLSADSKREARLRFYAALEKRRRPSVWKRLFSQPAVWAGMAAALAVIIFSAVSFRETIIPPQISYATIPVLPSPQGNFVFLVSDEVNAIDEFSSLTVNVDRVRLLRTDGQPGWVEFTPEVREFDLSLLPGEKTQEIWRGDLPEGRYTRIVLQVNSVSGTLKASGETIEIKLPSNKLEMPYTFDVSPDLVTSFVYDLTVVHAGNSKNGGKYLLKPQVGESGVTQKPAEKKTPPDRPGQDKSEQEKHGQDKTLENRPPVVVPPAETPAQDKSKGKKEAISPDTKIPYPVTKVRNLKYV